jgi:hypothetical protein
MATNIQSRRGPETKPKSRARKAAVKPPASTSMPSARKLAHWIDELGQDIPEETLAKFPRDLAMNHEHYLYGHPKQPE